MGTNRGWKEIVTSHHVSELPILPHAVSKHVSVMSEEGNLSSVRSLATVFI